MTHKPAVGFGGFGRDNTSELTDRSSYIASATPSSSLTSKAPPPLPRLAAEFHSLADPWERPERHAKIAPLAEFIAADDGDRLPPAPENDPLGFVITQGVEDALTAHQVTGLGVWAAGSAGRVPALAQMLPAHIEAVTIFAHADQAGQDGALALAEALDRRGVEVLVEGGLS